MKEKRSKVKPTTSSKKRPVSKKPATTSRPITTGAWRQSLPRPSVKSPAAITRPVTGSLAEETQAQLDGLQDQLGRQQESLLLTSVQNDLEDIETGLAVLPTEIEELRTRGYVFCSFLENKINVLAGQWEETHERVSREVNKRVRELEREADEAESAMRQAMSGSSTQIARAESAIETLERKVSAARSVTQAMYDTLQQNVRQTKAQVEEIRWLLDQIDEASFQLHPAEDPVAVCKAQYLEREDEGPEGLLYLTDERLIFERKEKVATKKVLFITTEKETVQEFIFEVHVGQVEEVTASDKRKLLRRQEMLELLFAPEADLSGATLRLIDAQNEEWAQLIGRVKSGEIAKERTQPKDESVVEAARAAPTKCTTCGATLSVEIVRGMREITCEYCGSVIRL